MPECKARLCMTVALSLIALACLVFDRATGVLGRFASPEAREWAKLLSNMGDSGWSLLISALLAIEGAAMARLARRASHRARAAFFSALGCYCFLSLALSGLIANLLKRLIGRARPGEFPLEDPFHFLPLAGRASFESFPSGHSTTIGALFMIAALLAPRYRIAFAVAALWCGMGRVMLGAHYPSDVLAGLSFGAWFTWFMAIVFARHGLVFRLDAHHVPVLSQPLIRCPQAEARAKRQTSSALAATAVLQTS